MTETLPLWQRATEQDGHARIDVSREKGCYRVGGVDASSPLVEAAGSGIMLARDAWELSL